MLRTVNGCTESQFPLVPKAVLVCSYDDIGTVVIIASLFTHSPCRVLRGRFFRAIPEEECARSALFDPVEMISCLIVVTASAAPVSSNCSNLNRGVS
jgi:hypothetical protein